MHSIRKNIRTNLKILLTIPLLGILVIGNSTFGESTSELRNTISDLSTKKIALQDEIATFDSQIIILETQIAQTEIQLTELKLKINQAETDLQKQKGILNEYLRTMYIDGQVSTVELIAKSENFSDFVNKSEYQSTIQQNIQNTTNKINELKSTLEKEQEKTKILEEQQKSMKIGLEQQRLLKNESLTQVTIEEKAARDKLAEMLSRGTITCSGESPIIYAKNPIFQFPLDCGYISQGFGDTAYALEGSYNGNKHNGFDVGVGANTGIHPIGNGTVYATGEGVQGNWGNWIIINHNNGFYSLYAHMISPAFFSTEDAVTTDDVIGGVGGTPIWPIHLHLSLFEGIPVGWGDGSPGEYPGNTVDPLNYMNITISTDGTDWDPANSH